MENDLELGRIEELCHHHHHRTWVWTWRHDGSLLRRAEGDVSTTAGLRWVGDGGQCGAMPAVEHGMLSLERRKREGVNSSLFPWMAMIFDLYTKA